MLGFATRARLTVYKFVQWKREERTAKIRDGKLGSNRKMKKTLTWCCDEPREPADVGAMYKLEVFDALARSLQ